jgi:L-2-hydroxyglutarate oxidase LhgO
MAKRKFGPLNIAGIIVLVIAVCAAVAGVILNKTIQIRSDAPSVEFVTEGDTVRRVNVSAPFPYNTVVPTLEQSIEQDEQGNVVSETRTYTLEANFVFLGAGDMKIDIDVSEDIAYTYILQFADRTVTIAEGTVVS